MKNKKDWKENKIVKKIIKLNKDYEFRFMFAGCCSLGNTKIENMWECKCCGTLTDSLESVYHKTKEDSIGICSICGDLWKAIPFSKIKT